MSIITNADAIVEYIFCPEYEWKRREFNTKNIDTSLLIQRFEKRKKRYQDFLQLKQSQQKTWKNRKKKQSFLSSIFSQLQQRRYEKLQKTTHPLHLLSEEKKENRNLTLMDKDNGLYADIKEVRWDNGKLVVTIDRSDIPLPSYAPYTRYSDLIAVVIQMNLLYINFFTENIKGVIRYQNNKKKKITWQDPRVKPLLKDIDNQVKKVQQGNIKTITSYPFRCRFCSFKDNGCEKASTFPRLESRTGEKEDEVQIFQDFHKAVSSLLNTHWQHWDKDVRDLGKVIVRSKLIQDVIKSYQSSKIFDVEEMIQTAAWNKKELYNRYLSPKDEFSLGYQILLYLSKTRNVGKVETLIKSYGMTQKQDTRTHKDILVQRFFSKILKIFLGTIEFELKKKLPKEVANITQNLFNHSQVIFSHDESNVNATMIINDVDDEYED